LEDILKQNKTKNDQAEVMRDEFNKFFKIKTETVNENFSNDDIAKIKGAVEGASSFMGIGSELKKLGMKYDFSTSPLPVYMIKKGSKTFVLVNKKYADKPDFIVNDTAGGLLESKSVNETKFKSGDKVIISHPTLIKPFKAIVSTTLNAKGEEVLVLKGNQGVWDAKFAKLDEGKNSMNHYISSKDGKTFTIYNKNEQKIKDVSKSQLEKLMRVGTNYRDSTDWNHFMASFDKSTSVGKYWKYWTGKLVNVTIAGLDESIHEGNAFGMAVTKAKQDGKKEFEFNGKIYKVKKGSYEKNEAAKKAVTENTHVVVSMSKSGYGTLMSKPVSQKDAEKLKKATTPVRGEELKVITVSDAKSLKNKLVGREILK
jgi:hypothetical protein